MLFFMHNCGAFLGRNEALLIGAARRAIDIANASAPVTLNVRSVCARESVCVSVADVRDSPTTGFKNSCWRR